MMLFRASHLCQIGQWDIVPNQRYVVSGGLFEELRKECEKAGVQIHSSSYNSWLKPYHGHDLNGRSLAVYRQSAFGDSLIVTAIVHWLKSLYPKSRITVYTQPHCLDVWRYNLDCWWVGQAPTFDALNHTDYHLLYEGMIEMNWEQDQENCYDSFFRTAGFRPDTIPEEYKRPKIVSGEVDERNKDWWDKLRPDRYILWHWCPSGTNRMYPPELSRQTILKLAEKYNVVICGHTDSRYESPNIDHWRVKDLTNQTGSWRQLIPMLQGSLGMVAPDSSLLHLAGAFPDTKAIGLWGPFHYKDRVEYYRNVHNIHAYHSCPHAPCRAQHSLLPRAMCASAEGYTEEEVWCRSMANIEPSTIIERVEKLFVG